MENVSVSSVVGSERWETLCGKLPKREIVYFCQVVAIYMIIIACVVNLSIGNDNDTLWASLLSASIGFLLPSPKLPKNIKNELLFNAPVEQ